MTDSAPEDVGTGEPLEAAEVLLQEASEPPEPEVVVVKPKSMARPKKKPEAPAPAPEPPKLEPNPEPKKRGRPRKEPPKQAPPAPSPAPEPISMEVPSRQPALQDPMALLAAALHGHRVAQEDARRKMYEQFVFGNKA
jgi:hypothetical protein